MRGGGGGGSVKGNNAVAGSCNNAGNGGLPSGTTAPLGSSGCGGVATAGGTTTGPGVSTKRFPVSINGFGPATTPGFQSGGVGDAVSQTYLPSSCMGWALGGRGAQQACIAGSGGSGGGGGGYYGGAGGQSYLQTQDRGSPGGGGSSYVAPSASFLGYGAVAGLGNSFSTTTGGNGSVWLTCAGCNNGFYLDLATRLCRPTASFSVSASGATTGTPSAASNAPSASASPSAYASPPTGTPAPSLAPQPAAPPALDARCPAGAANRFGPFAAVFLYAGGLANWSYGGAPPFSAYAQLWGGGGASGQNAPARGGGGAYVSGALSPALLSTAESLAVLAGAGGAFAVQTAGFGGVNWNAGTYTSCAGAGAGASALGGVRGGAPWIVAGAGGGGGQNGAGAGARWEGDYAANAPTWNGGGCSSGGTGGGGGVRGQGGAAGCGNGNTQMRPGLSNMNLSSAGVVTGGVSSACGGSGGGGWGGGGGGGWWVGGGGGSSRTTGFLSGTTYGENARGSVPGGVALAPNYTSYPRVAWGGTAPLPGNSSGGAGAVVLTLCFACPAGSFPSPGGGLTFAYTGASENFTLPPFTTAVHVSLWGGGGSGGQNLGIWGGGGAHVAGWVSPPPPPLSTLVVVVGGGGVYATPAPRLGGAPFIGGSFPTCSGTGSGASAVGVEPPAGGGVTVMAVAGGGGTAGQWGYGGAARWDGFAPPGSAAAGGGRGTGTSCSSPNG